MTNNQSNKKKTWFLEILRKDLKLLIFTLTFGILAALLGLATAIFTQKLIDNIIPSKDLGKLTLGIASLATLLLLKVVVSYAHQYVSALHGKAFNLKLINEFFKKLLYLPKTFFDQHQTGGLTARMNDSVSIQQTIAYVANTLVLNVLVLVISCSVLFVYSVEMGLIALTSLPVFLLIAFYYRKKMAQKVRAMLEASATKESNYISTIQNADLVKSHNKQDMFSKINYNTYNWYQEKLFKLNKAGFTIGSAAEFVGTIFFLLMLSYASYITLTNSLSIGEFAATIGIASGMLGPIAALGLSLLQLQGANVAFDRMHEFVSLEPEFKEESDSKKEKLDIIRSIRFKNVSFSYTPQIPLLRNINFLVNRGEMICVYGENGGGKTTILNMIMSLLPHQSGQIQFNNNDIQSISVQHLRNKVAIVAQQSKLFDKTVIENICLDDNYERAAQSISFFKQMGFNEFIDKLPQGYHTMVQENGINLSGGQKQIISLARALYKQPDVLLLDEPTASLDNNSENFVVEKLKEFSKRGIVIMVSHKLKPAKECDRIYVLENGIINMCGSHHELMLTENIYSRSFSELVC